MSDQASCVSSFSFHTDGCTADTIQLTAFALAAFLATASFVAFASPVVVVFGMTAALLLFSSFREGPLERELRTVGAQLEEVKAAQSLSGGSLPRRRSLSAFAHAIDC